MDSCNGDGSNRSMTVFLLKLLPLQGHPTSLRILAQTAAYVTSRVSHDFVLVLQGPADPCRYHSDDTTRECCASMSRAGQTVTY